MILLSNRLIVHNRVNSFKLINRVAINQFKPFYFSTLSSLKSEKKPSQTELEMGKVIRVLRDDFENFLDKGLSETDIYHTDIILTEPTHSNLTLRGKFYYLLFIKMARMSLKWYFKDLTVTATHFNVIEDLRTISIRWKLEGTSRPANIFTTSTHLEPSVYEGVFTYKLSESGKVIVHKIDSIYPTPYFDKLIPKLAWWWWLRRSKPELSLSSSLPSRKE